MTAFGPRAPSGPPDAQSDGADGGFTMVELLVVVVITGVLATALLGVFSQVSRVASAVSPDEFSLGTGRVALQSVTRALRAAVKVASPGGASGTDSAFRGVPVVDATTGLADELVFTTNLGDVNDHGTGASAAGPPLVHLRVVGADTDADGAHDTWSLVERRTEATPVTGGGRRTWEYAATPVERTLVTGLARGSGFRLLCEHVTVCSPDATGAVTPTRAIRGVDVVLAYRTRAGDDRALTNHVRLVNAAYDLPGS